MGDLKFTDVWSIGYDDDDELLLDGPVDIDALQGRVKDLETGLLRLVEAVEWMCVRWMKQSDIRDARREVIGPLELVKDLLA